MTDRPPPERSIEVELLASIDLILETLRAVSRGDQVQPLELPYPEAHPVGALASSVNLMTEALAAARVETEASLRRLSEQIETIERQREAIRNLSIPVIEVWSRVLCVPIVGALDSSRSAEITVTLLESVVRKKARHAVIDITAIEVMDTQAADYFLRMARAVRLLGAECVLSGIHPNIAQTIVHMGVDLGGVKSFRTLRDALRHCIAHS